jgi:outer membrane protein, multidrug efflux system
MLKSIYVLCLAFSIAGCALMGPNYQSPSANAVTNHLQLNRDDNLLVQNSINLPELSWWQKFQDPQLNRLIAQVLANNNTLQIALANLTQAQATLKKVQMQWVPNIIAGAAGFGGQSFSPSFTNNSNNPALDSLTPSGSQGFSGYGVGFVPSYTLNIFSQLKQGEIAKLNIELQQSIINAVRLGLIGQAAASYFSLLGLEYQLQLSQNLLHDAEMMRNYTVIAIDNGSSSQFNLIGIDQAIAGLKAKIPNIKQQITKIQDAIMILSNSSTPYQNLSPQHFNAIRTDSIIPVNLSSNILKQRPDVQSAEYQLKLNNAKIGLVTTQFFPTISLTGMLGNGSMALAHLFSGGSDFWATQLGAAMPLLDLSLYAQIDQAKGGYTSAYYNYIQTVRTSFAQVNDALSDHANLNEIYIQQDYAYHKALELYKIAQTQYQLGSSSYANTIFMKLNVDYALINVNQAKLQQLTNIVTLYQVLGGGYAAK